MKKTIKTFQEEQVYNISALKGGSGILVLLELIRRKEEEENCDDECCD